MYYVRAVDITVLPTISSIVSEQASATENMEKKYTQLLDYLETHANCLRVLRKGSGYHCTAHN